VRGSAVLAALSDVAIAGDVAVHGRRLSSRVVFDKVSPIEVLARVPDLAEHRVRLRATRSGLDWDCDCEDALRALCMHVAAVAFALRA
jgi:hypothetical protein